MGLIFPENTNFFLIFLINCPIFSGIVMSLCDVLANCPGYVMSSHVDSWDSLVTLQRSNRSIMEGGMDAILRFLIIKILFGKT